MRVALSMATVFTMMLLLYLGLTSDLPARTAESAKLSSEYDTFVRKYGKANRIYCHSTGFLMKEYIGKDSGIVEYLIEDNNGAPTRCGTTVEDYKNFINN